MELEEMDIPGLLAKRDEATFEQVFKSHYKALHAYAFTILKDETAAEEMVQQVFLRLWEKADKLALGDSLRAYLYRAVHNESLNYIKHMKVRSTHRLHVVHQLKENPGQPAPGIQEKELAARIREVLNDLPEQCRTIFQLSRFEDLKYRDIANRLGLSIKTVENQMGKALKILRSELSDYLPLGLLILLNL